MDPFPVLELPGLEYGIVSGPEYPERIVPESGSAQLLFTPEIKGGLGYRWTPRFVQTYVGVETTLRINTSLADKGGYELAPVVTGTALVINADIVSPRLPGLFLRVGGAAGNIGQASHIQAGIALGLLI